LRLRLVRTDHYRASLAAGGVESMSPASGRQVELSMEDEL